MDERPQEYNSVFEDLDWLARQPGGDLGVWAVRWKQSGVLLKGHQPR